MAEEQAKDKIIKKALTDSAFKKALLADPNAVIEKELGVKLPAGVKVKVVEDTATTLHLVLPATGGSDQMSDADLEKVSGGNDGCGVSMWPSVSGGTKPGMMTCTENTGLPIRRC